MGEDKKDKSQKNKGVSTVNEREPTKGNTYFSDTDSFTVSLGPNKSISKVKHELQTVIDLMGPASPEFQQTTSNDADNEESTNGFSNTSIKFLKVSKTDEDISASYTEYSTDQTVPPDITLQDDTDLSKVAGKNSSVLEIPDSDHPQYMCPPPLLPANVMFNSECMCPQIASYIQRGSVSVPCVSVSKDMRKCAKHKNVFYNLFRSLKGKHHDFISGKQDYYSMNIKHSRDDHSPPRRLVFDLVGDIPRQKSCQCKISEEMEQTYFNENYDMLKNIDSKHLNNEKLSKEYHQCERISTPIPKESTVYIDNNGKKFHQKTTYSDHNGTTKVDVYYFDHGNSSYFKTTDSPPIVMTEALAEKTEAYTTKFWAEVFGTLHIGISFGTSFVLQLFRFVLYSFLRPLTIGLVQLGSDYFFKPCIATLFNAVIQPPLIFVYNIATSIRDICDPIAEAVGYFLRQIANVVRAFRLVENRRERCAENGHKCDKKMKEENVKMNENGK